MCFLFIIILFTKTMRLNNYTIILILSYLNISEVNKIKNINRRFFHLFYSKLYINKIKEIYNMNDNLEKNLFYTMLTMDNRCLLCRKSLLNDKLIILYNLLCCDCKCLICFKEDNCDCYLYPYGHYECLKKFEILSPAYKVYRKFYIPFLSNKNLDGLFIKSRIQNL